MKHLLSIIFFTFVSILTWAQECFIPMAVHVNSEKMSDASVEVLENQLSAAITTDGIEGGGLSLFTVVANVSSVREELISGVRPQYLKIITLNLSIVNNNTGEKYSTTSVTLKGAGATADRAYNSAFSKMDNDQKVIQFLAKGKNKIIAYYDSQIKNLLAESRRLATMKQYEAALSMLVSVPTCCNGYAQVERELESTFRAYENYDCAEKIMKARAVWAASQTESSARLAGAYLSAVSPSASCSGEAVELMAQIQTRMGDSWEFGKEIIRGNMSQESERIAAARAIGVAYGQNQKAQTHNDHWIVR